MSKELKNGLPLYLQRQPKGKNTEATAFWRAFVLTLLGFAIAIAVNYFFPQISRNVTIQDYTFGPLTLNRNRFYDSFSLR